MTPPVPLLLASPAPSGRLLAIALLLLTLFGCSSQPQLPSLHSSWEQWQQQLQPLTHWQVLGKINIRTSQENTTASLNWLQHDDQYRIYMAGPLGQGAVNISGSDRSGVTLEISGEERLQADSPEQLLDQRLGWAIPVRQLPYWIRGLPAPQSSHTKEFDLHNRIQMLNQQGWTIRYLRYQTEQQHLPRRIELRRGDALKVTLILKQWQLGSAISKSNS